MSMEEFDLEQFEEFRELTQQRDDLLAACKVGLAYITESKKEMSTTFKGLHKLQIEQAIAKAEEKQ